MPQNLEKTLLAYMKESLENAHRNESSIKFRQAVLEEFNRLVREGVQAAIWRQADAVPVC